jgi:ABC-type glycerol-3-phosphate transport system substrate-binding protein
MKKRMVAAVVLLSVGLLSACSGGSTDSDSGAETAGFRGSGLPIV